MSALGFTVCVYWAHSWSWFTGRLDNWENFHNHRWFVCVDWPSKAQTFQAATSKAGKWSQAGGNKNCTSSKHADSLVQPVGWPAAHYGSFPPSWQMYKGVNFYTADRTHSIFIMAKYVWVGDVVTLSDRWTNICSSKADIQQSLSCTCASSLRLCLY